MAVTVQNNTGTSFDETQANPDSYGKTVSENITQGQPQPPFTPDRPTTSGTSTDLQAWWPAHAVALRASPLGFPPSRGLDPKAPGRQRRLL